MTFAEWLSALYALPEGLVVTTGIANLAYGVFSLSGLLTMNDEPRQTRP